MSKNITVNDWSDEQKIVMLAKAMGWKKAEPIQSVMEMFYGKIAKHMPTEVWQTSDGFWIPFGLPDFYNESQMAMAWRVLNWAMGSNLSARAKADIMALFYVDKPSALEIPPADAQRIWLDKIIELAIEAGIVEPGKNHPTKEGLKRYPPNGVYTGGFGEEDKDFWRVCTCTQKCETPCKGECGCQACDMAYNDFLSAE